MVTPFHNELFSWLEGLKNEPTVVANIDRIESKYNQRDNTMLVKARLKENSFRSIPTDIDVYLSCSGGNLQDEHRKNSKNIRAKVVKIDEKKMQLSLIINVTEAIKDMNQSYPAFSKRVSRSSSLHFIPIASLNVCYIRQYCQFVSHEVGFQWNLVQPLMPLRKVETASSSSLIYLETGIDQMNLIRKRFESLNSCLKGIRYVLSHSQDISEKEKLCEAKIEELKCTNNNKIGVLVSIEGQSDIWENVNIYFHPLGIYSKTSEGSIGKLTNLDETASKVESSITLPKSSELVDQDLESSGCAYKYLGGNFERHRSRIGGEWKSLYLAELRFQPKDLSGKKLVNNMEIGTDLRLSLNASVPGPVFVKVVEIDEEESVITVHITGFERPDVKEKLSRSCDYFLQFNDTLFDCHASFSTESGSLDGYEYVISEDETFDEMCKQIGDLTVCESTVRTYHKSYSGGFPVHVRLSLYSENICTKDYERLEGVYVRLISREDQCFLLAVVSRVMKNMMILSVISRLSSENVLISAKDVYFIRVDHYFMEMSRSLRKNHARFDMLQQLRENIITSDYDLRFKRCFPRQTADGGLSRFCQFYTKGDLFERIEDGTVVLLAKCCDMEETVQMSDFTFATKTKCPEPNDSNDSNSIWFEIGKSEKSEASRKSNDYFFENSYYYIEFLDTMFLDLQDELKPIDVIIKIREKPSINASRIPHFCFKQPFIISEVTEKVFQYPMVDLSEAYMKYYDLCPTEYVFDFRDKQYSQLYVNGDDFSEIGFVSITDFLTDEDDESEQEILYLILDVAVPLDLNSNYVNTEKDCFEIGKRIFFALDHISFAINIVAHIAAKRKNLVKVLVDQNLSNMEFVKYWINYMLDFEIKSIMMLCYESNDETPL